jgi:putative sterol carrier protein
MRPLSVNRLSQRTGFSGPADWGLQVDISTQRFASLKDLTLGGQADLAGTFHNLGSTLADAGFDVVIEYQIGEPGEYRTFCVRVADGTSTITESGAADAQLRVAMSEQTWKEMASGGVSPADAFLNGQLRVIGDTVVGAMMMKHLAGTPGRHSICGEG